MASEWRIVGPPGTGKTSLLARQVEQWAEHVPPERIVLTSYTRAAAAVLAGRIAVPRENIATLHALAYRGIGKPPLAETGKLAALWNSQNHPVTWQIGGQSVDLEEGIMAEQDRGLMLADYNLYRATLREDSVAWERCRYFAEEWEAFKAETGSIDFQDMIDFGYERTDSCPGEPEVLILDEAQDLNPSQWRLIRKWGASPTLSRFVVAGDPAQSIFGFVGAAPDAFMTELPAQNQMVLSQSWRMPVAIHTYAERWLSQHSPPMMEGRVFRPRDVEGDVGHTDACWRFPDALMPLIEEDMAAGRTVLILATCSYMLTPTISMLRQNGVPFHNPYRRSNGAWNPLRGAREGQVSTVDRLLAYLKNEQSAAETLRWFEMLEAKAFTGTKKNAMTGGVLPKNRPVLPADLIDLFIDEANDLPFGDIPALLRWAGTRYERPLTYAAAVINRRGRRRLQEEPLVAVGSIHSVKGGEADCVYLYPDMSVAGAEEMTQNIDATIRQFYVGMTRARERLVICAPDRIDRAVTL